MLAECRAYRIDVRSFVGDHLGAWKEDWRVPDVLDPMLEGADHKNVADLLRGNLPKAQRIQLMMSSRLTIICEYV